MASGSRLRIIGGELRGKRLFSPPGRAVRPTANRLRETIFNIIAAEVKGAVVLDLFAGTGAFGIEALSRGADSAWFLDRDRHAVLLLEKNLAACRLTEKSRRIRWDIEKNLDCLRNADPPFTLVFMDPPYGKGMVVPALSHVLKSRCLSPGCRIVIEHGRTEPLDTLGKDLDLENQRRYGNTLVSLARYLV